MSNKEEYEGFNLSRFSEPDRAKVLIRELELDGAKDKMEEEDCSSGNHFIINERTNMVGYSIEDIKEEIKMFKAILTKEQIGKIGCFIRLGWDDEKLRDKIYYSTTNYLDKWKRETEEYKKIEQEHSCACNLLYYLLDINEGGCYNTQYQNAFIGKEVKDVREEVFENDGEYFVLTDSEADIKAGDYLREGDGWEQAVSSGNTTQSKEDWIKQIMEVDGRGSMLNHYDGVEIYVEIDGVGYYIYRQN